MVDARCCAACVLCKLLCGTVHHHLAAVHKVLMVMLLLCRFDCAPAAVSCSLSVYADGSVLVNHGGIEMGQGLSTKVQMRSHHLASQHVLPINCCQHHCLLLLPCVSCPSCLNANAPCTCR